MRKLFSAVVVNALLVSAAQSAPTKSASPAKPAAPELTRPLDFSGFTADTTRAASDSEITCLKYVPDACSMKRVTLGGMVIDKSSVDFNKNTQRIQRVVFWADNLWMDTAIKSFTAKYGAPTEDERVQKVNKTGGPYEQRTVRWENFEKGDNVFVLLDDDNVFVGATWRQNIETPAPQNVDF